MSHTTNVDAVHNLVAYCAVNRLECVLCGVGGGLLQLQRGGEGGTRDGSSKSGACSSAGDGCQAAGGNFSEERHLGSVVCLN